PSVPSDEGRDGSLILIFSVFRTQLHEDSSMTTLSDVFSSASQGIHGEIITWHMRGLEVSYQAVLDALDAAGLPKSVARERLPRNAFARAARTLSENRIIRKLDEDETDLMFQF